MYMKSKLTEQIIERTCLLDAVSAAATSAHVSLEIDRKGFNTAFFVLQGVCATGAGTYNLLGTLYQTDVSTGTYTVVNSAVVTGAISTTYTLNILPTSATVTGDGKAMNLSGLNRFIKFYVTPSAAVTNTITVSVACILGDGQIEPAV